MAIEGIFMLSEKSLCFLKIHGCRDSLVGKGPFIALFTEAMIAAGINGIDRR
jgi:hypothetical protein